MERMPNLLEENRHVNTCPWRSPWVSRLDIFILVLGCNFPFPVLISTTPDTDIIGPTHDQHPPCASVQAIPYCGLSVTSYSLTILWHMLVCKSRCLYFEELGRASPAYSCQGSSERHQNIIHKQMHKNFSFSWELNLCSVLMFSPLGCNHGNKWSLHIYR